MRYATLACGMLALLTHSVVAQDDDDNYTPYDRGVGEWIGFQNYRVAPRYETAGPTGGFLNFDARTVQHDTYYRPFHTNLTRAVRCAPESWSPRGMGNLWNPVCTGKRMDYLPYRMRTTVTEHGPAYYRRIPEQDCPNGCSNCQRRRSYGLGACHKCLSCNSSAKSKSCSLTCKLGGKSCLSKKGKSCSLTTPCDKSCTSKSTSCTSDSCTAGTLQPTPEIANFTTPITNSRTSGVRATSASHRTVRPEQQVAKDAVVSGSEPVFRPSELIGASGDQKAR